MDLQSALICVLVFVVSGAILLLISMFGIKEKSYEEALAEQRKLKGDLLGANQKIKSNKEKKQKQKEKKETKKLNKEKKKEENIEEVDNTPEQTMSEPVTIQETTKLIHSSHSKFHVEFDEPTVLETPPQTSNKKRVKKDKIRSILLNKEKTPVADVDVSNTLVNHFETIHPKDEFELLHVHQDEKAKHHEPEVNQSKKSRSKKEKPEKADKTDKIDKPEKTEKEKVPESEPKPPRETTRANKNQKQVQNVQQPVVEHTSIGETMVRAEVMTKVEASVPKPAPVVQQPGGNTAKDKKKKKSELNTLQQMTNLDRPGGVNFNLLMPLVRKADLSHSDIQNLIDMLLNKQHEAPKILDDWSEGKADPVQKLKKQLAEKERVLAAEQEASMGVQAKLREVRAELNSERSRLMQNYRNIEENLAVKSNEVQQLIARNHSQQQKIQQLQVQLNEEMLNSRKLREEHNAFQIQRKNMDLHLQSMQETEKNAQSQNAQMHIEIEELKNIHKQLNIELISISDKNKAQKDIVLDLTRHWESKLHHCKSESNRHIEDLQHKLKEVEHNFQKSCRREEELILKCQRYLEDNDKLKKSQSQSQEETTKLQSEINCLAKTHKLHEDENNKLITQLRLEMKQLQEEKTKLETTKSEAITNKANEVEVLNLQNELSSVCAQLKQKESQLTTELEKAKSSLKEVENELQEQRNKNDELRKKNWKVMEALNLAESTIRTKPKQTVCDTNEIRKQIQLEEQENYHKFIQRLFPDVKIPNNNQWMNSAEKVIKNHLSSLKSSTVPSENNDEVQKLQAQIANYKTIIDDTETILNRLQTHVEQEERNWRYSLSEKDAEIESLKERHKNELQSAIENLESRVTVERQTRQDLETDFEAFKARTENSVVTDSKHTQHGSLLSEEKLTEENNRLGQELSKEQERCRDLSDEILRLQSQTVHSKSPQNHTSNGMSSIGILDSESASNN